MSWRSAAAAKESRSWPRTRWTLTRTAGGPRKGGSRGRQYANLQLQCRPLLCPVKPCGPVRLNHLLDTEDTQCGMMCPVVEKKCTTEAPRVHTGCVEPHAPRTTGAIWGMRHQNKVLCDKETTVEEWEVTSRLGRAPSVTGCFVNWESLDIPGREAHIGKRNAKVTRSAANLRLKVADTIGRGRPGQGRSKSV